MTQYPSMEARKVCREQYRKAINDIQRRYRTDGPIKVTVTRGNKWHEIAVKMNLNYLGLKDEYYAYAMEHGIFQEKHADVYIGNNAQYGDIVFMVI